MAIGYTVPSTRQGREPMRAQRLGASQHLSGGNFSVEPPLPRGITTKSFA